MKINDTILKPVLTEKATTQAQMKVYTFEVAKKATKFTVKQTLEKLYGVKVGNVKMLIRKGKIKKVGRKMKSKQQPDIKIAHVQLKEGSITIFPQV